MTNTNLTSRLSAAAAAFALSLALIGVTVAPQQDTARTTVPVEMTA